jgi:hypothetical protein
MGRFGAFLFGVLVGAGLVFGAMKYHVVRARDGVHFIPKVTSGFRDAYVDIREFQVADWQEHRHLAMALIKADRGDLMDDAATFQLRETLDGWLQGFYGQSP